MYYKMAGSASGQDEANPVFSLATRVGKMGLSRLHGNGRSEFVIIFTIHMRY